MHPRRFWLAVILITALVAGLGAGLLADAGGMNTPTAILTAAGAFSGAAVLLVELAKLMIDLLDFAGSAIDPSNLDPDDPGQ
ncbi:hypothetical protein [Actinoplanes sp. TFC3]|uniref:hypothetical protein n=1 Tax=Actinoplanes sp. TFC3 TaxID=1710355 RepID=UPI0008368EAA|nr:hypothetical protein [Actinoplanes sp. TFC3]